MTMELNNDLVVEIISYLPLKLIVQCKVLSKDFNIRISDPKFSQTLYQHQKISTLYISSSSEIFEIFSINPPTPFAFRCTQLPCYVTISASCKGLLLLSFPQFSTFCVFNPTTGAHQLIPYTSNVRYSAAFAVDYPTSDQYKLVAVGTLVGEQGYMFRVFSSEGSSWRELPWRMKEGTLCRDKPIYTHDSLHWLTWEDDGVLAFDTKREQAILIDLPEFKGHIIRPGFNTWLGLAQGLLNLLCIFEYTTVIATYDYGSSNWRVSHTFANFTNYLPGYARDYCFPIWIESKQVPLIVYLPAHEWLDQKHQILHEYDSESNRYKRVRLAVELNDGMLSFEPTLAGVRTTLLDTVRDEHLSKITATLAKLKGNLTEGCMQLVSVPVFNFI